MIYQKRTKVFVELYLKIFRLENLIKKSAVTFVSILLFTLFQYYLFSFDIISPLDICNDDFQSSQFDLCSSDFQSPLLLLEISATDRINTNQNCFISIQEPFIKHYIIIKKDKKKDSSSKISNFNKNDNQKTMTNSSTMYIADSLGLWRYALFDIQISS